jgi:hypothetical protein
MSQLRERWDLWLDVRGFWCTAFPISTYTFQQTQQCSLCFAAWRAQRWNTRRQAGSVIPDELSPSMETQDPKKASIRSGGGRASSNIQPCSDITRKWPMSQADVATDRALKLLPAFIERTTLETKEVVIAPTVQQR